LIKHGNKEKIGSGNRYPKKKALVSGGEKELALLRVHIEDVTKSIIDLIGERQKLSIEVARLKKKDNVPVENLKVESSLATRTRNYAESVCVDPLLATSILSLIIDSSKMVQRKEYYEEQIRSFLRSKGIKKVGVIGAGRMGGWFASYFAGLNQSLIIFDRSQEKSRKLADKLRAKRAKNLEEIAEADVVVVAIPISHSAGMIKRLAVFSRKRTLARNSAPLRIVEICSVKQPLVDAGLTGKDAKRLLGNAKLYSIHPMFGPDAKHFAQNKILQICGDENDGLIEGFFPHYRIYPMDAQTHDRMMSYVLSLPHITALLFAYLIAKENSILKMYSGPSFDRMLDISLKVLSESPSVYFDIQSSNRANPKMFTKLRRSLEHLGRLQVDNQSFRELFERTSKELRTSKNSSDVIN
jgi:prephenate dehydrogenase/chorismate mutase